MRCSTGRFSPHDESACKLPAQQAAFFSLVAAVAVSESMLQEVFGPLQNHVGADLPVALPMLHEHCSPLVMLLSDAV